MNRIDYFTNCADCGNRIKNEALRPVYEAGHSKRKPKQVCTYCVRHYNYDDYNGIYVNADLAYVEDDGMYIEADSMIMSDNYIFVCDWCGKPHHDDGGNYMYTVDGDIVCIDCVEKSDWHICESCDRLIPPSECGDYISKDGTKTYVCFECESYAD